MNRSAGGKRILQGLVLLILIAGCGSVPLKHFYEMVYLPTNHRERLNPNPWPCTIRVADFNIEAAYNRPEIVYRQSPFQLQYYYYRVWAVKPSRMVTDLVFNHLTKAQLVSSVIRRYDEYPKPDYDLAGNVEAIEEYDSGELWFAHLALTVNLSRVSDGSSIYTRSFDLRKRVYQHTPEYVIRELSTLMEYIMTQVIQDIDAKFAKVYPIQSTPSDSGTIPHSGAPTGEVK